MAVTYGQFGIRADTAVTGTNVASITIDLNNNSGGISFISGTLAAVIEGSNDDYRCQLIDSSGINILVRAVTGSQGSLNRYSSLGTRISFPMNYQNLGALNSNTQTTGERANFFMVIDNSLNNSSPFRTPVVTCDMAHFGTSGLLFLSDMRLTVSENARIDKVRFSCEVGNLAAYDLRLYSVFEET
jgi:hypothetical protein